MARHVSIELLDDAFRCATLQSISNDCDRCVENRTKTVCDDCFDRILSCTQGLEYFKDANPNGTVSEEILCGIEVLRTLDCFRCGTDRTGRECEGCTSKIIACSSVLKNDVRVSARSSDEDSFLSWLNLIGGLISLLGTVFG